MFVVVRRADAEVSPITSGLRNTTTVEMGYLNTSYAVSFFPRRKEGDTDPMHISRKRVLMPITQRPGRLHRLSAVMLGRRLERFEIFAQGGHRGRSNPRTPSANLDAFREDDHGDNAMSSSWCVCHTPISVWR